MSLFHTPLRMLQLCAVLGLVTTASLGYSQTIDAASQYKQECAACHIAYPPGMLPAGSWSRIMGALVKHYGTDASLDEPTVRQLSGWLASNAGTFRRVREEPPQDRITTSAWYVRQHREVSAATWKRASIGSASNCAACHSGAAKGNFNEDDVRIPK